MSDNVLFSESQKFRQWWLWLIMLGVNALVIFGAIKQALIGEEYGAGPASNTSLLFSVGITLMITTLVASVRLNTEIRPDGIYVRFFPFHLSFRHYKWRNLSKVFIR